MALVILRAIFVMVSVGIAVLIFNSAAMRQAEQWVPWAVLAGMVALPLTVMGIDASIRRKDLTTITAVYFGLLVGVLLTYIAMLALAPVLPLARSHPAWAWMPLILGCVLCYVCTSLLLQTRDDFRFLIPFVEFARDVRGLRPNVLDAAAIVDGRIADLAEAGIFESRFVVPSFVLDELQVAADSADRQRRLRGRRGLDVLSRLRSNKTIEIDVVSPGDDG
ncbi:MAG: PIN/TRAM domain-containing protein, partial [Planctomycetia bacterium]